MSPLFFSAVFCFPGVYHLPNGNFHFDNGIMTGKVTLDHAGRVVLPKAVRDELRLSPGDTLDLTVKGEDVTLRPRRAATPLQKEQGVWVLRTGRPITPEETQSVVRALRARD
jgi:AbrB family looped-hinge helix DNA binding protein